jgi:hypothetical protein
VRQGDKNMKPLIIVAGTQQIWAVDPITKQRLRIKLAKDRSRILDMHSNNSGVYHASEIRQTEQKSVRGERQEFEVNFVQAYDTISGNPFLTIIPPGYERRPLEERCAPIRFEFFKEGGSLLYRLNDVTGVVFERCNGETEETGETTFLNRDLSFDYRRVASLEETITYAKEIDKDCFARAFKRKNKQRYARNRRFFSPKQVPAKKKGYFA